MSKAPNVYREVADSDSEIGDVDNFLEKSLPAYRDPRPRWRSWLAVLPWALCAALSALSLLLLLERHTTTATVPYGSYEKGFSTDIRMSIAPMVWAVTDGAL